MSGNTPLTTFIQTFLNLLPQVVSEALEGLQNLHQNKQTSLNLLPVMASRAMERVCQTS
ncbi:hypothetical protein N0Y54_42645 [Nostoc punctiforme UO1]|uniref:hypothetical protein n=1 Tax=Nostoc punctiforme TaxID=272131 RepID=UPI0030A33B6E